MTSTEALQGWLALEHEAVWLYPVIGARVGTVADRARQSYGAHSNVRDALLDRLHQIEVEPVPTMLSYDVGRLRTKAQARAVAQRVEREIAAACLTLTGDSTGDLRTYAIAGLRRAALAEIAWGGRPDAFPGLP